MNYLLDTRTFLLWASDASKLPPAVVSGIQSSENDIYVSLASLREIQVKSQLGLVDLPHPIIDIFLQQEAANNLTLIPIGIKLAVMLPKLPTHHKDPFDRLLVAQALVDDLTIITNDPLIKQYPVKTFW